MRYLSLDPSINHQSLAIYGWTHVQDTHDKLGSIDIVVSNSDNDSAQDHKLIDQIRSTWIIWSAAPDVLDRDNGRYFGDILLGLANIGYHLCWRVLDDKHFGGTPCRRVYLTGYYDNDIDCAGQALFDPYKRNYPYTTSEPIPVLQWIAYNIMQYDERFYLPW